MHVLRMQQLELTDDKCCVRSGEQTNCCKRETANRNGNSACCAKNASTVYPISTCRYNRQKLLMNIHFLQIATLQHC